MKIIKENFHKIKLLALLLLLVFLFFACFLIGRFKVQPGTVFDILCAQIFYVKAHWDATLATVVLDVRLPRILGAILIGGGLSLAGASYQSLFKNPLVSPDILGVTAGAGFGASLALLFGSSLLQVQLYAFIFGVLSVVISYAVAKFYSSSNITILVLAGIAVAGFFRALISVLKYSADPTDTLPSIVFWLMGSISKISNEDLLFLAPPILLALLILWIFRHKIDALNAGEDVATSMGVNVAGIKLVVVVCATMLTVSAVSIAGIVGWVGLIIPHVARMLSGASFEKGVLSSFLLGAIFLLLIDSFARGVGDAELPLGVLTALLGTPAFILLLSKVKKGW